jgi:hypothetical protein
MQPLSGAAARYTREYRPIREEDIKNTSGLHKFFPHPLYQGSHVYQAPNVFLFGLYVFLMPALSYLDTSEKFMNRHRVGQTMGSYHTSNSVSPRLLPMETLSLSPRLKSSLSGTGLETVEDVLRWRHERVAVSGESNGDLSADLEQIDDALNAVGLFRAAPLLPRNWAIYHRRTHGATFSSLAKIYSLSPAGARVAFYKVKETLDSELKNRKVFCGELATRVQDLPLPTRAKFGLQRANVFTLASLLVTPPEAILQMRGLGATSLQAIRDLQMQFVPRP